MESPGPVRKELQIITSLSCDGQRCYNRYHELNDGSPGDIHMS